MPLVDELADLVEGGVLDAHDLLVDEPLDTLGAVWSGQGALVVEDLLGSGQVDGEPLLHGLLGIQVPMVEGVLEVALLRPEQHAEDGEALVLSVLVDDVELEVVADMVDLVFRAVVEVELDGVVDLGRGALGDADGGEREGRLEVLVGGVVGDLGVVLVLGGQLEEEVGLAPLHILGDDGDGRLLLAGLALSSPTLLVFVVLGGGRTQQAHQQQHTAYRPHYFNVIQALNVSYLYWKLSVDSTNIHASHQNMHKASIQAEHSSNSKNTSFATY